MKNFILFFICLFCLGTIAQAQEASAHFSEKNAIKINPIGFGNASFQITYERFLGDRNSSILLSPTITLKETNEESIEGWEAMAQYRFYLTHVRKDKQKTFLGVHNYGFYTGVYGLYSQYQEEFRRGYWDDVNQVEVIDDYEKNINAFEGGALIGIQIDVTQRILIDFYVGGGVKQADITDTYLETAPPNYYYETYGVFDPEYKGVKPKLGLLIGFTF